MARQAFARQRELIQQLTRRRSASAPLIGHGECRTHRTRLKKTETLGRHAVNGGDLWRDPLEVRKATLASVLAKAGAGIRFNEHIEGDGPTVFAHACKLGLEGIVSKRKDPLPLRPLDRLAQVEESERSGGEAGGRGGLGALTAPARAFSAASHKTSTLRSPAFASSMIVLAMISSLRSRGHLIAARAISNAMPRRRAVSGSKVWPLKKGLMGTRAPSQGKLNQLLAAARPFPLSAVKPKSELNRTAGNGIVVLIFRKQHGTRGDDACPCGKNHAEETPPINNKTRKSRRSRCGAICRHLHPWMTRPLHVGQVRS